MKHTLYKYIIGVIITVAAWLFWWLGHPELISFHEQNQLFLFTSEYLTERLSIAGGFADYISEFLVQFFFYIGTGAAIIGMVLAVMQLLLCTVIKKQHENWNVLPLLIAVIVTLLMWAHLMDENAMLSYPIAIILSLSTYLLCRRGGWILQLFASLPLYWLVGPAFVVQVALAMIDAWKDKKWAQALVANVLLAGVAAGWIYTCRTLWVAQYPWNTVLAGINYHRLTLMMCEAPQSQYDVLFYLLIMYGGSMLMQLMKKISLFRQHGHIWKHAAVCWVIMVSLLPLKHAFDENYHHDINTHVLLEQQYLVRKGDWNGIIAKAEVYNAQQIPALNSPLSANAINLALVKTQQMSTRMFEFPQSGIQGLIMPNVRDNVSNVISMEAFWELGFVNEALRYAFDSQESIPNCRKSGRFMRRMAECNIVNGNYLVASKYIDLLKQSLFYSDWAKQAETYLYQEEKIALHPEWSQKRQLRLDEDFLYYWPELHKMIGKLVLHNRQNQMAFNYFMASLLLKGDFQSFVANLPQQPKQGEDPFPKGYREYVAYMQAHQGQADAITSATVNK